MRYLVLFFFVVSHQVQAQNDGSSPQFWNNLGLGWNINNSLRQNNEVSYNFLADKDFTWQEVSYWGNVEYSLYPILEGMGGLYAASVEQNLDFRTNEIRPFLGLRIHSNVQNRYSVSNLSRFEWRFMHNKEDGWNPSFRFRNRTTAAISINKPTLLDEGMLSFFGYFEVFSNSERVVERFFTQLKYKFGLAYRFSDRWRINLGAIFQQSENTIEGPSTLPTGINTNVVIETGITYSVIQDN